MVTFVVPKHHVTIILNDMNTLSCPSKSNSKQIELKVHTSSYWGLRLTLCYKLLILDLIKRINNGLNATYYFYRTGEFNRLRGETPSATQQVRIRCYLVTPI